MIRWIHLVSAGVWTGGLITLAVAVGALRKSGADRKHLRAMAQAVAKLSWGALGLLVITGMIQVMRLPVGLTNPRGSFGRILFYKLALVGLSASLALFHQMTAPNMSPKARGILQASLLLLGLGIFWLAVQL